MPPSVVRIADVDVHVEGTGDESIVMVHGWPDTYRLWDAQVAALAGRYRCLRFTLPGFDGSRPRRARSLDELTGFLRTLVARLAPDRRVILMLHDWGCVIGYEFYCRHPQLVSKIIGVDIGDVRSLEGALKLREKAMVAGYQWILAAAWLLGGGIGDGISRLMARGLGYRGDSAHINAGQAYPYYLTWFGGAQAWRRQLQAFDPQCPMLFVYGRRKPVMFHAPAWAEALHRRLGSQVVDFDCGHWVMLSRAQRFHQVVGDWLARTA